MKQRHRYRLGRAIATDYELLEAVISNGRLMEAVGFVQRGFLSELTNPPSEAFAKWRRRTTLELRARIRQAAAGQWTLLSSQGRWKQAVEPAQASCR